MPERRAPLQRNPPPIGPERIGRSRCGWRHRPERWRKRWYRVDIAHQNVFGVTGDNFGVLDVHQNIDTKPTPKKQQSTAKTPKNPLWCENAWFLATKKCIF